MSGRLAGLVWESALKPILKPYAAVLAGFANEDGTRVHPSIARVAWMVNRSERSAQRAIATLTKLGVLRVVTKAAPNQPTHYWFDETAIPARVPFVAKQLTLKFSTIRTQDTGVAPDEPSLFMGDISSATPDIAVSPDPSGDPSEEERAALTRLTPQTVGTTTNEPIATTRAPTQSTLGPLDVTSRSAIHQAMLDTMRRPYQTRRDRKARGYG